LTRERLNYEVSQTEREVTRNPGAIRRMTVAVLVNGIPQTAADGATTILPRPDDELTALRDLVASAVGLDEARGDVITIKSMTFDPGLPAGSAMATGFLAGFAPDPMSLIQLAVLALVALVLGLFVIRPILLAPPRALPPAVSALPAPGSGAAMRESAINLPALTGEIAGDDGGWVMPGTALMPGSADNRVIDGPDPVERLRNLIAERQQDSVEILRSWLDEREERA
jgi:flagellar M-ring protein FliF